MDINDEVKLIIGVILFITWVVLVTLKIEGSEDIISAIKLMLIGLGAYHLNNKDSSSK